MVTNSKCEGTKISTYFKVSLLGVDSLGQHFACLRRGFVFYKVKKNITIFQKEKGNTFTFTFNHFYSEKSSKREK